MAVLPVIDVTDTHLTILDMRAFESTPAHQALMDWCTTHGIDPHTIPATAPIQVNRHTNTITYERMYLGARAALPSGEVIRGRVYGLDGPVTETIQQQLMQPIAPWPAEVLALAAGHIVTDTDLQAALAEVSRLERLLALAPELDRFVERGEPGAPDTRILKATPEALGVDVGDLIRWIPTAATSTKEN